MIPSPEQLCNKQFNVQAYSTYSSIASLISLITGSMVLASYTFLPNLRKNQNLRYIGYLALANVLLSISCIGLDTDGLPEDESTNGSNIFFFLMIYSGTSVISWAIVFSINVYNIISNKAANWVSNEKLCLFLVFIAPIPFAIGMYLTQTGGYAFENSVPGFIGFGSALIILILSHLKIFWTARKVMNNESAKRVFLQTIGYSIVLTVNLGITILGILIERFYGCLPESYIWVHSCWFFQGLTDAIVYGVNPIFREEIWAFFSRKDKSKTEMLNLSVQD